VVSILNNFKVKYIFIAFKFEEKAILAGEEKIEIDGKALHR
jgi:hypothetical protein